jgi:hypothetical protein
MEILYMSITVPLLVILSSICWYQDHVIMYTQPQIPHLKNERVAIEYSYIFRFIPLHLFSSADSEICLRF